MIKNCQSYSETNRFWKTDRGKKNPLETKAFAKKEHSGENFWLFENNNKMATSKRAASRKWAQKPANELAAQLHYDYVNSKGNIVGDRKISGANVSWTRNMESIRDEYAEKGKPAPTIQEYSDNSTIFVKGLKLAGTRAAINAATAGTGAEKWESAYGPIYSIATAQDGRVAQDLANEVAAYKAARDAEKRRVLADAPDVNDIIRFAKNISQSGNLIRRGVEKPEKEEKGPGKRSAITRYRELLSSTDESKKSSWLDVTKFNSVRKTGATIKSQMPKTPNSKLIKGPANLRVASYSMQPFNDFMDYLVEQKAITLQEAKAAKEKFLEHSKSVPPTTQTVSTQTTAPATTALPQQQLGAVPPPTTTSTRATSPRATSPRTGTRPTSPTPKVNLPPPQTGTVAVGSQLPILQPLTIRTQ